MNGATLECWQPVLARLASCGADPHGAPRIVTLRVLVRADGTPVAWSRPEVVPLEPKATALTALETILKEFGGD
jgi:hypothetical protein